MLRFDANKAKKTAKAMLRPAEEIAETKIKKSARSVPPAERLGFEEEAELLIK